MHCLKLIATLFFVMPLTAFSATFEIRRPYVLLLLMVNRPRATWSTVSSRSFDNTNWCCNLRQLSRDQSESHTRW